MNPYQDIIDKFDPYILKAGLFDGDEFHCPFCSKILTCQLSDLGLTEDRHNKPFWKCKTHYHDYISKFYVFSYFEPCVIIEYSKSKDMSDNIFYKLWIFPQSRIKVCFRNEKYQPIKRDLEIPFFDLKLDNIDAMIKKISTYLVLS